MKKNLSVRLQKGDLAERYYLDSEVSYFHSEMMGVWMVSPWDGA